MAQLERTLDRSRRSTDSPKTPKSQNSPTFEQLQRVNVEALWSPTTTPRSGMHHGHEECLSPNNNKKSVLSKVKEGAKKLKHTLSGRKNVHGNELCEFNSTPTYVDHTLDDDDDNDDHDEGIDDPEYLGAPMYESEAAPENLKENARQNPRATPVVAENHRMPNSPKSVPENDNPVSPNMAVTESFSDKLCSEIAGLTMATSEVQETSAATNDNSARQCPAWVNGSSSSSPGYETKKIQERSGNPKQYVACTSPQTWDKGVSVKEYFMNKLEPGDDERALSHAITEAISPGRIGNNTGVVEKVKDAVTSFFWQEENVAKSPVKLSSSFSAAPRSSNFSTNSLSSKLSYVPTANSSPHITHSANANEVLDEENHGKILQAN